MTAVAPAPATGVEVRGDATGAVTAVLGVLGLAVAALAVPGAARVVPLAVVGGVLLLALLWARRTPVRVLDLALWLWVLAPGLRRVVDLVAGYSADNLVLLAAPLAALCAGAASLDRGVLAERRLVRMLLRVVVVVGYAAVVAVVVGRSPAALGLAAVQLLAPVALALCALLAVERRQLLAAVDRFTLWVLLLVGGYGVVQYFTAPAWDAQWLRDVEDVATSFGRPFPLEIRVFSTVNDPGSLAIVLVFCLLWTLLRRRLGVLPVVALALGASCLGLTLVRSAWIAFAVALLVLVVRGWVRVERLLVAVIGVAVAASLFGSAVQPVVGRFQEARSAGTSDESFQARLSFQAQNVVPALLDPVGDGLGATGTAARRDAAADQRFADTDSGYLEVLLVFGGPLGLGLLTATLAAVGVAVTRPDARGRAAAAFAATAPVQLVFSSIYSGVIGAVLWLALVCATDPSGSVPPGPPQRPLEDDPAGDPAPPG